MLKREKEVPYSASLKRIGDEISSCARSADVAIGVGDGTVRLKPIVDVLNDRTSRVILGHQVCRGVKLEHKTSEPVQHTGFEV